MEPTNPRLPIFRDWHGPWREKSSAGAKPSGLLGGSWQLPIAEKLTSPPFKLEPGTMIGGYEVTRELGRGGLEAVFEARDLTAGGQVALKVCLPEVGGKREMASRFRAEAALAARADHPAIVPVLSSGSSNGLEYYAESFMAGPTLDRSMVETGDLTSEAFFRETARRFAALARGLGVLHRLGILHRAIRPSNIFLQEDRLLLGDFKAAADFLAVDEGPAERPEDRFESLRSEREPAYMAPEEFVQGGPFDPRSDIYSFGLILFEASAGILPFPRCSADLMARLKLTRRPIAPRRLNPEIPLALEAVIRQAIEANPLLRTSSADDLASDLERIASRKRGSHRGRSPECEGIQKGSEGEDGEERPELARIA